MSDDQPELMDVLRRGLLEALNRDALTIREAFWGQVIFGGVEIRMPVVLVDTAGRPDVMGLPHTVRTGGVVEACPRIREIHADGTPYLLLDVLVSRPVR